MDIPQKFTTIDQQIKLLKERGLIFEDECFAYNALSAYGYYNIINGYKEPYINKDSTDEEYKPGITFKRIFSLFSLDHAIRNQVMLIMLDFEENLKAITSYVIGEAFGHKQEDYLNFKNYQNRKSSNPHFSLDSILKTLKKASCSDKDPIKYHRINYGNVPPWVLFKGIYFSTLINFIKLQKPQQKEKIVHHFYQIQYNEIDKYIKDLFTDTLFMCLEYRNLAAHGGRIYNYVPNSKVRITEDSEKRLVQIIPNFFKLHSVHSIGTLICLFGLFQNQYYRNSLIKTVEHQIKEHCKIYPDDISYLTKNIGIESIIHISDENPLH